MSIESEWITDRLPTVADGDAGGFVRMKRKPSSSKTDWTPVHWSHVGAAAPWQHTNFWESPTDSDRIAALERKMAGHVGVNPDAITALERRIVELEKLLIT